VKPIRAIAALALMSLASVASAAPLTFDLDKPHTQVGFSIRHFFTKVSGRFQDFSGTLVMDEKDPAASSVSVTIQAASIYTANERRDTHLRSPDFFAADSFPTLTFKSTKVEPLGKDQYKVTGDLAMRGVTKPIVLNVEFLGMGEVAMGGRAMGTKAGFDASATLDRRDFGILWNKTLDQGGLMLGNDVDISLHIEANLRQAEAKQP
jgi:polyisoprenoid-binding protein YceI